MTMTDVLKVRYRAESRDTQVNEAYWAIEWRQSFSSLLFRISASSTDQPDLFESIDIKNSRLQSGTCTRCAELEKFRHISQSSTEIRSSSASSTIRLALASDLMHYSLLSTRFVALDHHALRLGPRLFRSIRFRLCNESAAKVPWWFCDGSTSIE